MHIVICEDSILMREGLSRLLHDAGHEIDATVSDAPALLRAVADHGPDLALVDVRLPPGQNDEGLRAALDIRASGAQTALLVLSQYVEEQYAAELISQGQNRVGYLLKDRVADVAEFLEALDRVESGGTAIDPEVIAQLLGRRRHDNPLDRLTPRELDVLQSMAEGKNNAGIATALFLSEGAIEKYASNIFTKIGITDTATDNRRVNAVLTYLRNTAK